MGDSGSLPHQEKTWMGILPWVAVVKPVPVLLDLPQGRTLPSRDFPSGVF